MSRISLTRYGLRELAIATILLVLCLGGIAWLSATACTLWALLAILPLAVYGWILWFFRDPQRETPSEPGLVISPADGRVADITNVGPDSELGRDGVKIGIFMNVFNVHVNRSPVEATVEEVIHRPGAFLDVRDPHASEKNESTTIRLRYNHEGTELPIVVRQIAGLVARRIVTDLKNNQSLQRGEKIGMIKFGSRLEVFLPNELQGEVRVQLGQKAFAGSTILFAAQSKGTLE